MSETLLFVEDTLQIWALQFMGTVYFLRLLWILHFKAGGDRQAPTGRGTSPRKGILYSWLNVAMPWAMESTRKRAFMYAQFIIFHLGVVSAIGLSFIIPYAAEWLHSLVLVRVLQVSIGLAFAVGVWRIIRRMTHPVMRKISSPDDYFSLILLTVWFFFAFLSVPNNHQDGEGVLMTFFLLTAFFLVYVPFSKISHYLYYPFTRFYLGRTLGHRGVFPLRRTS
ncbi:MAG: hypothetical protein C4524_11465 [Candidatus Zixiibacteriota bacterium]|nr:MAG: hypothetical protein C4524_11465 [candidate division Zixibacteria bacterium]